MPRRTLQRYMLAAFLAGGTMFGPCGITTLQFQDFVSTTLIRTGVTTLASLFEAATIDAAQEQDVADDADDGADGDN